MGLGDVPNKRGDGGGGDVAEEEHCGRRSVGREGVTTEEGGGRGCAEAALGESEVTGTNRWGEKKNRRKV